MQLEAAEARAVLLRAAGFHQTFADGPPGARQLLDHLGYIQLDPIDRVGTNAELVAWARVAGLGRGLFAALAGHSFEHFAKERCLLHPRYFPLYRDRPAQTAWWRQEERMARLDDALLADVLAEVRERGPVHPGAMTDRGRAQPLDWSGWKGTASRTKLALEVLWTRCEVVVAGRDARGHHLYDVPERALPAVSRAPSPGSFEEVMVLDRARACGLLARGASAAWSTLREARRVVPSLVEAGRLVEVEVAGRRYLAPPDLDTSPVEAPPRVLGPLDPLLWDRQLLADAFAFEYVWEVYKPATQRRWGYYVCPVLSGDRIVGRVEARRVGDTLRVERSWDVLDDDAVHAALIRLSTENGCSNLDRVDGPSRPGPRHRRRDIS